MESNAQIKNQHDPVPGRQAVQDLTGRRKVPHLVDPVPGRLLDLYDPVPERREAPYSDDPVPGRRLAHHIFDLVPGHLGRRPLIIDDEDDEVELTKHYTGHNWSSDWKTGKQVRVVDDELDPEPCYAEWLVARNDSVSVDISTHAVAEPEMDDGLAMEESKTIVLVVALFLWHIEVVHAMLVLAFTMGLTTFIEWVDPKVCDVTSWAKSNPRMGAADRDATDHFYAFHPNDTEKWLPPLQKGNLVGYLECTERCETSGESRSGVGDREAEKFRVYHTDELLCH